MMPTAAPRLLRPLAAVLLAVPATAHAAGETAGYGGLALSLLGVLAVFVALAWLARRFLPAAGARGSLRMVASLSVGARERVVVVELAEEWLVLGVGGGRVNLLARMPAGAAPAHSGAKEER